MPVDGEDISEYMKDHGFTFQTLISLSCISDLLLLGEINLQ